MKIIVFVIDSYMFELCLPLLGCLGCCSTMKVDVAHGYISYNTPCMHDVVFAIVASKSHEVAVVLSESTTFASLDPNNKHLAMSNNHL